VPSILKKTMVYLGLLDDEYDEYDDYDERGSKGFASLPRIETKTAEPEERAETRGPMNTPSMGRIRPLSRENGTTTVTPGTPGTTIRPQPAVVRPTGAETASRVHVVAPVRFGDAKEIADCLKGNGPVIVNLQLAERDLQRRMIDFCSGVTYALGGEMEKVADQVFLLTPSNVKVSDEERQRLQERNFERR